MAEFALIVPVFLLLVVGLLVFGRLFFYWIETNHLANETARWAVVDRNPYGPARRCSAHARESATAEFSRPRESLHRLSRQVGMRRPRSATASG